MDATEMSHSQFVFHGFFSAYEPGGFKPQETQFDMT